MKKMTLIRRRWGILCARVCGIAGQVDFSGLADAEVVAEMCRAMEHRGPDSRGIHADGVACLGAQRLAIIDIARGDQPVANESRTVFAVLNGEIYNFRALRADLVAKGHAFASECDTEVLVHLYEEHGEDLVRFLRGMFAFGLWDAEKRRLFCARDRVGKKPLFWWRRGDRLVFASELRALLRDRAIPRNVDPRAVDAFLAHQYVPHPLSIIEGVHKLPPATTLLASAAETRLETYWSLDYSRKHAGTCETELAERLRDHVSDATRVRMESEVPLGAFLSGGLDSSAVVASMAAATPRPVKTFSIGFSDRRFDETGYARRVAAEFGTDHHELWVEPDALAVLPRMARHYGEPYADVSAIPSFYLAELAKRHITVALNGDGGDESFAGYPRYRVNEALARLNPRSRWIHQAGRAIARGIGPGGDRTDARSRIAKVASTAGLPPADRFAVWMAPFDPPARRRLITPDYLSAIDGWSSEDVIRRPWAEATARNMLDRFLEVDVQTFLPGDLLVKMDIATMAHSLEARSPLLDQSLMEFAAALPHRLKLDARGGKRLLKSAFRGVLPDEILDRPKRGFEVPLARWLREDLRDLPADVLLDPRSRDRGYFRTPEVERLIAEHRDRRADHSQPLWTLIQFEMWHREVLEAA